MAGLTTLRLGAYELIERIGGGGMAEVYRARQLSAFGREVAIKAIRPDLTEDPTFRLRFLYEAQAISRLSHPNILPLIEFGEEQQVLYLVTPWVREGTLSDLLKQRSAGLPLEEALPLFIQLCGAAQYAHEEGIIHRDIKPHNVLLQRRAHVLLADFGIALDRAQAHMTGAGAGVGTAEYMAPEQAIGQSDARSDIYSLGIVLYQLLTGVLPFSGDLPIHILLKHANEPLPDPRQFNPALPEAVVEALQTALAKSPEDRFESAEALGSAVQPSASRTLFFTPHARLATLPDLDQPRAFVTGQEASQWPEGWAPSSAEQSIPPWGSHHTPLARSQARAEPRYPRQAHTGKRGPLIGALVTACLLLIAGLSLFSGSLNLNTRPGPTTHSAQQPTATPSPTTTTTNNSATSNPAATSSPKPKATPPPKHGGHGGHHGGHGDGGGGDGGHGGDGDGGGDH